MMLCRSAFQGTSRLEDEENGLDTLKKQDGPHSECGWDVETDDTI